MTLDELKSSLKRLDSMIAMAIFMRANATTLKRRIHCFKKLQKLRRHRLDLKLDWIRDHVQELPELSPYLEL